MDKRCSKRKVSRMHKIYQQTQSLTVTGRICGCSPSTVKKYRDLQRWLTPEQIKECRQSGNDSTLTPDIAIRLIGGWRLHMEDVDLCWIVGITTGQLKMWLHRNTPVTVIRTLTKEGPDGKPLKGKENLTRVKETIGLRDLRAREWASFEYSYLQKLELDAKEAESVGDYNTAFKIRTWILSKRLPKKFAESAININNVLNQSQEQEQKQPGTYGVDDLDLSLETRKQILAKIREKSRLHLR